MKKLILLTALPSSMASALSLGLNVNGGYSMVNAKAFLEEVGSYAAADLNMTGFSFQLGVPVTIVQMDSLGLFAEPHFRYMTMKSKAYSYEPLTTQDEPAGFSVSYSGMQLGAGVGTKFNMGSLALATQVFYDASVTSQGKRTGTGIFQVESTFKQGAMIGFQADGYYNLSPSTTLGGFFTYGSSQLKERSVKISTIIFGGSFSMSFGAGSASEAAIPKTKATKKKGTKKKTKKKAAPTEPL